MSEAPLAEAEEDGQKAVAIMNEDRWFQEDQLVLYVLQNSLEASLLEAYSFCETAKELWEILKNVYGNSSNLMRIFEVKKALHDLHQSGMEFTVYFGKYRALWAELEMLRPSSIDPLVIKERREQDKVFGLLMNLDPIYSDLIKHLLREDKLPSLEDVCAKVQKEQSSHGMFGNKGELISANKGELIPTNKVVAYHKGGFNRGERKRYCEHCKIDGHTKYQCWVLHPHLKWINLRDNFATINPRGNFAPKSNLAQVAPSEGSAKASSSSSSLAVEVDPRILTSTQQEYVKKADFDALVIAFQEAKTYGISFQSLNRLL